MLIFFFFLVVLQFDFTCLFVKIWRMTMPEVLAQFDLVHYLLLTFVLDELTQQHLYHLLDLKNKNNKTKIKPNRHHNLIREKYTFSKVSCSGNCKTTPENLIHVYLGRFGAFLSIDNFINVNKFSNAWTW